MRNDDDSKVGMCLLHAKCCYSHVYMLTSKAIMHIMHEINESLIVQ